MPSFDSPMVSSPVRLLRNPVMSAKILRPVRLLRDPVISAKTKKVVPPLRKSGGQRYVDPSKFNPTYLSEHMALSIPIAKCSAPHVSSDMTVTPVCSPISYENAPYSMEMPSHYDNSDRMDCVTEDDGKLQEANVESLRSVVVPPNV